MVCLKETSVLVVDATHAGENNLKLKNLLYESKAIDGDKRASITSLMTEILPHGILVRIQSMNEVQTIEQFPEHLLCSDGNGEVLYVFRKNEILEKAEVAIDMCHLIIEEIPNTVQSYPSIKLSDQISSQTVQFMTLSKEEHGAFLFGLECTRERRFTNIFKKRLLDESEDSTGMCFDFEVPYRD